MTIESLGYIGAKVQTWRGHSPRKALREIVLEGVSRDLALKKFRELVDTDHEMLDVVIEYWFTNNYNSLVRNNPPNRAERAAAAQKYAANVSADIIRNIEEKAKIMLLSIIMPNGKSLRSCTGKECKEAGGWFVKVGNKVGNTRLVGSVLSEDALRALLPPTLA